MPDVTDVFVQTLQLQRDPGRSSATAASKRTAPQWQPPARRIAGAGAGEAGGRFAGLLERLCVAHDNLRV